MGKVMEIAAAGPRDLYNLPRRNAYCSQPGPSVGTYPQLRCWAAAVLLSKRGGKILVE